MHKMSIVNFIQGSISPTETNSGQSSMITKKESKNLVDSYSRKGSGVR